MRADIAARLATKGIPRYSASRPSRGRVDLLSARIPAKGTVHCDFMEHECAVEEVLEEIAALMRITFHGRVLELS